MSLSVEISLLYCDPHKELESGLNCSGHFIRRAFRNPAQPRYESDDENKISQSLTRTTFCRGSNRHKKVQTAEGSSVRFCASIRQWPASAGRISDTWTAGTKTKLLFVRANPVTSRLPRSRTFQERVSRSPWARQRSLTYHGSPARRPASIRPGRVRFLSIR
jgi:hypothetical protein